MTAARTVTAGSDLASHRSGSVAVRSSPDRQGYCWSTPWVTAADVEDRAGLKQGLTRYRVPAYLGYANCEALAAIEAKYSFQTAS